MCEQLTLLARYSERHQILSCEHGTIHLVWGPATIHVVPETFRHLVTLLGELGTSPAPEISWMPQEEGGGQLWIGPVGLVLTNAEDVILRRLLLHAWRIHQKPDLAVTWPPSSRRWLN